jgi:hypothetical protein
METTAPICRFCGNATLNKYGIAPNQMVSKSIAVAPVGAKAARTPKHRAIPKNAAKKSYLPIKNAVACVVSNGRSVSRVIP